MGINKLGEVVHIADLLATLHKSLFAAQTVRDIWEIGSRDGEDALELLNAFPQSVVHSFEPKPDTFPKLVEKSLQSQGRVIAHQLALNDFDGSATFFAIDPKETVTTWADGNPGASSLFRANGEYDGIEKYVQTPIEVNCAKASTLIDAHTAPIPSVVWMDVQGAEACVLRGFESYLESVDLFYIELSLKPMYEGQALAQDVIRILRENFYFHSVASHGQWQFDAIFVSKRASKSFSLTIRDALLRGSIATHLNIGISEPAHPKLLLRWAKPTVLKTLQKIDSHQIGIGTKSVIVFIGGKTSMTIPLNVRALLEVSLPDDPLSRENNLPLIDIVIPCVEKDLSLLPLVIEGAKTATRNPINSIRICVPSELKEVVEVQFPDALVMCEDDIVEIQLRQLVRRIVPVERQGWALQQLIKYRAVTQSTTNASLILDADTVLLKPRSWLAQDGRQVLSISHEFHHPYSHHASRYFGTKASRIPLSFVTHHQLMQKDVVLVA